jgi:hypothetical protein
MKKEYEKINKLIKNNDITAHNGFININTDKVKMN